MSGDSFQVQIRLAPYDFGGSVPASKVSVSVTTQLAAQVGTDRVTFGVGRPNIVTVNGSATALSMSNPVLNLSGGQLIELSPSIYQLVWNTGEKMTVDVAGTYLNYTLTLPQNAAPGSVVGLLGSLSGAANDFQLADGTVLQQPISSTQLYGEFADAWRIPAGTQGLFDYPPGENTDAFTIASFPTAALSLSDFPASLVQQALALAAAAGITDAVLAQDAALDYLVSGNPAFFNTDANVSAGVSTNVVSSAQITTSPPAAPFVGATALSTSVVEAISGPTVVDFGAYLTETASAPIVVDYAVVANPGDIGPSAFGGTLPSGSVTIPAGAQAAQFEIDLPDGALGTAPTGTLEVQLSNPSGVDGVQLIAPNAQTQIVNNQPVAGATAVPQLALLSGNGMLTQNGSSYTLDLGTLLEGEQIKFAIDNAADAPADQLSGSITATSGSGFTLSGGTIPSPIAAGQSYDGLSISPNTSAAGSYSETFTFDPVDGNASGYSSALTPITLTITADFEAAPTTPAKPSDSAVVNGYVNAAHDTAEHALTGAAEDGSTVTVYDSGTQVGTTTADAATGDWSFTIGVLADASSHSYTVTATDAAGNVSQPSAALSFAVDTTVPATPAAPGDSAVINSYVNAANDTAAQALTGTAEDGSTVTIYDNSTQVGTTTADAATGDWSFTIGVLADASTHGYTATATDAAGNVSQTSPALSFVVDTTAPATPAAPSDSAVINGYVNGANDTAGQALTGTAEDGSTVTVYDNSTQVGTTTADAAAGAWSFTIGTLADASTHGYTVMATDAAGNMSQASPALSFVVDTVTPTVAVSIDNTDVNVAHNTGTVTFAFSEAPTSFALADTSAVGGTLSNLQQTDATHYTATFTGAANTDISNASVSVTAGSWQEGNGNAGAGGSTASFTVDTVTPTVAVSIDNTDVNVANDTGTVTFAFSEAPTSFVLADTSAVGGTLSNLQKTDATHYTATFTGAANTDISNASVSVTAGSWQEGNGNAGAGGSTTPSRSTR